MQLSGGMKNPANLMKKDKNPEDFFAELIENNIFITL